MQFFNSKVSLICLLFLANCSTNNSKFKTLSVDKSYLNLKCTIILKDNSSINCLTKWSAEDSKSFVSNNKLIKVQAGKYNLDEVSGYSINMNPFKNNTYINIGGLENLVTIKIPAAKYVYGGHIIVDTRKSMFAIKAINIENNGDSLINNTTVETITSLAKLKNK